MNQFGTKTRFDTEVQGGSDPLTVLESPDRLRWLNLDFNELLLPLFKFSEI